MDSKKIRFPYIVKMEDEVLSQKEIDEYKLEARRIEKQKHFVRFQTRLVNFFCTVTFLILILILVGLVISYFTSQGDWVEYGIYLIAQLITLWGLGFYSMKLKEKSDAWEWIDESELTLIENDPAACETLEKWVHEHECVRLYVEKIASLGRLPTFAEFHCVEYWVNQKEKSKPVESLKATMNIQQAHVY